MSELELMACALRDTGAEDIGDAAHFVMNGYDILSVKEQPGLHMDARVTSSGLVAKIRVDDGVRLAEPLKLCIGVLHAEGRQELEIEIEIGRGASARFVAHCIFPVARRVQHVMDADVIVREGAEFLYNEVHYHGPHGGVEVLPTASVVLEKGARYVADFSLLQGRVGRLGLDYSVVAHAFASAELSARVFGRASDVIEIKEKVELAGEGARSIIKTRVALCDDARADIIGVTEGRAPYCRGHVDCVEIVQDRAIASASPIVRVTHPLAKVTHEAAIGSVDRKQMETLMAHGMRPEEAVDMIVRGMLG